MQMITASMTEIAAFSELTKKQQKEYLAEHPKSKFGAGAPAKTAHTETNRKIRQMHMNPANHALRTGLAHAELHKEATRAGDTKGAALHLKKAKEHHAFAEKHIGEAHKKGMGEEGKKRELFSPRQHARMDRAERNHKKLGNFLSKAK